MGVSQASGYPFDDKVDIRTLKNGEASQALAVGDCVFVDALATDGSVKRGTGTDVASAYGLCLDVIAAGKFGRILFLGPVPKATYDASTLTANNVLTPGTGGTLAAITTGQAVPPRVARCVSPTGQIALHFNGLTQ